MAPVWERAAHSVYRMFYLYFDILILVISHLGFEGVTLVLIAWRHNITSSFCIRTRTLKILKAIELFLYKLLDFHEVHI